MSLSADPQTSSAGRPFGAAAAGDGTLPAMARERDIRLDFFRGLAMFIILIAHTPLNFFTNWIPARWGFSDATEIFVFCSGMASAIAFGRVFDRAGWLMGAARVGYRVWQVYWAHMAMFFTIAAMMAAIDLSGRYDKVYIGTLNLWKFFQDPAPQLVGLFTLTYVPNYFDILPMYLVILAMMPAVMALARVDLRLAAAVVIGMWLLAQGALLGRFGLEQWHLRLPAEPWSDRPWFFNPFGWQLVYFTGFALMRGWLPRPPVSRALLVVAGIVVLLNVPLSNIGVRELGLDWARDWRMANRAWFDKTDFGILRHVHFLALAYLAWAAAGEGGARLMASGSSIAARVWRRVLAAVLVVGQQSLAVFVFSMVFARASGFVMDQVGRSTWTMTLANLTGFTALVLVAHVVAWFKSQPWRKAA